MFTWEERSGSVVERRIKGSSKTHILPQLLGYALVICNHGPNPRGRAGVALEMSGVLIKICHGSAGEIPEVFFINAKRAMKM